MNTMTATNPMTFQTDIVAIRDLFQRLQNDIKFAPNGQMLRDQFKQDPIQLLTSLGINFSTVKAEPKAMATLVDLLGSNAPPVPKPVKKDTFSEPEAAFFNFKCWACVKSTETAISIAVGGSLGLLFAGGSIAASAIITIAPAVALILSVTTGAASQIINAILANVSSPGQFVNELAKKACKKPCK